MSEEGSLLVIPLVVIRVIGRNFSSSLRFCLFFFSLLVSAWDSLLS